MKSDLRPTVSLWLWMTPHRGGNSLIFLVAWNYRAQDRDAVHNNLLWLCTTKKTLFCDQNWLESPHSLEFHQEKGPAPPPSFLPFVSAALILELPAAAHSFPSAGDRVDESVASRGSAAAVTPGSWHIKYHFILLFTCLQVPGIEVARAKQIY